MGWEMSNMKKLPAVSFQLNGCNSMGCGEYLGLFFGWNVCNGAGFGYNGLDFVEASL